MHAFEPCQSALEDIHWYLEDLARLPVLSPQAEQALVQQIQLDPSSAAAQTARIQLVEANLQMVVQIAKRYQSWGLALADLIQEGNLALVKAVDHFNPEWKLPFRALASRRVHRALFSVVKTSLNEQYLERQDREGDTSHFRLRTRTRADLKDHTLDEETPRIDVSQARFVSLDASDEGEDSGEGDTEEYTYSQAHCIPCDDSDTPEGYVLAKEERAVLLECVRTLRLREQQVLFGSYLLDESLTLTEIGNALGVSPERVRQIKVRALRRLRHPRYWNLLWGTWS